MRYCSLYATFLFGALLIPGCTCSSDSVNRGDLNIISLDEEWRMGHEFAQQIARELPLLEGSTAQAYVQQLGEEIVAETELAERTWTFHVVDDATVNAFAVPGGHVYVHAGLIVAAENVAELSGVMAHEVAHITARHSTERLTKAYGLNVLSQLILSEDAGFIERAIADLIGTGALAKFSRNDEREADLLGLDYMYEAGYDPAGMAAMFETLLETRQRRPNVVEQFFSTHPLTERRIDTTREAADAYSKTVGLTTDDPVFRQIQSQLR